MKKNFTLMHAFIFIIVSSFALEAFAASYSPYPFKRGNYIKYRTWAGTNATADPRLQIPDIVKQTNAIKWISLNIQGATGKIVTVSETIRFENETEENMIHYINVQTGEGVPGLPLIIAYRLNAGDYIYLPSVGTSPPRIENTNWENTYLGYWRHINSVNINQVPSPVSEVGTHTQFFWDRETGILCEMQTLNRYEERLGPNEVVLVDVLWTMEIIELDASLWSSQNETPLLPVAIIVIVLIAAVVLILLRRY
ncbi:MAG: hypothetical protein JSV51_06975 [Candidatus Bathyarchaeota archaeon]|nr:MAG: hypothetical protein JSV51_06975 [Candidatus Bathyarchaeota archaeon]